MVNQTIFDYLKRYYEKYPVEELRQKILDSGYSEKDFDEAYLAVKAESEKVGGKINYSSSFLNSGKMIKISGISGIALVMSFVISMILILIFQQGSTVLSVFLAVLWVITSLSGMMFFYGFDILGKKYEKKTLRISSWIFIMLFAFLLFGIIISIIFPSFVKDGILTPLLDSLSSNGDIIASALDAIGILLVSLVILFILIFVSGMVFSAGLIGLRKEIRFAFPSGLLNILGLCSLIFGIGFLALIVSAVFEIAILFREGRKY